MRDKYDQTAASTPMELEEIESPRTLDTISNWALSPSARMSMFWFAMGGGLAMAIVGLKRPSDFLVVAGIALLFGGYGGMNLLRERLDAYEIGVHYTRREKPSPRPVEQERRAIDVKDKTIILDRPPKVVEYAGDSYQFSGKQLDRLEQWYTSGNTGIRRDTTAEGQGWSEIGIGSSMYGRVLILMAGRGYIAKPEGAKSYEWTARGLHEFLEI